MPKKTTSPDSFIIAPYFIDAYIASFGAGGNKFAPARRWVRVKFEYGNWPQGIIFGMANSCYLLAILKIAVTRPRACTVTPPAHNDLTERGREDHKFFRSLVHHTLLDHPFVLGAGKMLGPAHALTLTKIEH